MVDFIFWCHSIFFNHRGGPKPREFTKTERFSFQFNLLKTILQLEKTYEDLAQFSKQNCIILCDRGTMDASACEWQSNRVFAYSTMHESMISKNVVFSLMMNSIHSVCRLWSWKLGSNHKGAQHGLCCYQRLTL